MLFSFTHDPQRMDPNSFNKAVKKFAAEISVSQRMKCQQQKYFRRLQLCFLVEISEC